MTERFVYSTDPVTRAVTRRLADGAAFVAYGYPHSLAFWARHPDVEKFEGDDADETASDQVAIRVWKRGAPIEENTAEWSDAAAPERSPDLEFSGPGRMGDAFWLAHPDIEHVEVHNHLGDDSMDQDGWLVKVWLKGGD